jgi:hypothetical protein
MSHSSVHSSVHTSKRAGNPVLPDVGPVLKARLKAAIPVGGCTYI